MRTFDLAGLGFLNLGPRNILFLPPNIDINNVAIQANEPNIFGFNVVENPYLPENMGVMFYSIGKMTIIRFETPLPAAEATGELKPGKAASETAP